MNLSDHLRPLLRDHDCVIIPDFGGLVAEYTPARVQPGGRHLLSPPTRQVAFNQALTRNDGLLVDVLSQHLHLPAAEAREVLRQAVAALHHELQAQHRTELPGIGVFRQLAGRGLQFEYTGTDNLLAAAFGLPELTAHPVRVTDARLAREQQAQLVPRLRSASRGLKLRRVVPGATIGLLAGLAVAGLYLLNLHPDTLPVAWRGYVPQWEQAARPAAPQQAALARPNFADLPSNETATKETAAKEETVASEFDAAPAAATLPAAVVAPPVVKQAPAPTPTHVAKAKPALDPVEVLLAQPTPTPVRRKTKLKPIPAAAVAAVADENNVAKPIPLAQRLAAGTPKQYTVVAAPKAVAPAPVATRPVVRVRSSKTLTVTPASYKTPAKVAVAPAAPVSATTIKSRTGRYYIVVAAYNSLARAEEGRRNLAHAGRPAKVIAPPLGSRLYRLSAADFADRPSALVAASHLRQNPHLDKGLTVFAY
ncbi:hypothetical protein GO988_05235 [Hymenobacter sp. HMF4947]|uniref:SPOR domain-containing protein n=1 Tax=Hymenobacter ginkgonis TaxID=2682976 RepID=A0A7K1TBE7_9BACT|nr:SPOR domain-containing protein [Hymenobacter ginkgonis]MVN75724.1 hypothetical protein [Hymenobacter ginkgonis]